MTGFVLFLLSFVYYGLRAAEGPAWLDGSELTAASHLLAVPHPTGAPIYLVLGKLVQLVGIGPPAVTMAWLSALFAALAVERLYAFTAALCAPLLSATTADPSTSAPASTVWWAARVRQLPAVVAAGLFALTPGMLAIGHRAELYSMQLWLALAALNLALDFRRTERAGSARLGGLTLGLAAATHPYLTALMLPGILIIAGRRIFRPRLLLPTLGFVLLAGSSYGILALRGRAGGLVGWGDASSFSGWTDILLGRAFQKGFRAPLSGSAADSLALFTAHQLGILGGLLVPLGAVLGLFRLGRRVPVLAGGIAAVITLGLASRALWPFDHATPDTAGYFALPVGLLLALGALALTALFDGLVLPRGAAPTLTVALAAGLAVGIGVPRARDIEGHAGRELALRALAPLEPGALVLLDDFNLLFMTWYLQAVEGVRPDVTVVFGGFLSQPWYRRRLEIHAPQAARRLEGLPAGKLTDVEADAAAGGAPAESSGPLYVDYGIGAKLLPAAVRAQLLPAGLLLRQGAGPPPSLQPADWMVGRLDLDGQTQRALIWLHFRQACFHFERRDRAALQWHDLQIEALHPGIQLGAALARGNVGICQGG